MYCGKTANSMEMPFGVMGRLGPMNRVLDGDPYWRHLANTVERLCTTAISGSATKGGDTSSSQITLIFPV